MYWYNYGFYEEKIHEDAIKLSEEEYNELMEKIGNGGELQQDENGRPFVNVTKDMEERVLNNLRLKREQECFSIINRGQLWYNTLTEEQLSELQQWYTEWLDVTETQTIPNRPNWLL